MKHNKTKTQMLDVPISRDVKVVKSGTSGRAPKSNSSVVPGRMMAYKNIQIKQ